ncbi:PRC-barrel domain-containing protein [Pectinatus sottacetonis]|uniref:PRC-barrel domain-containing protein n=1 Tax=Pectinatus sottacetonis TaxID=1002795 RepID=UPI0018C627F4|nr:PRC-barrel domain-containing protein [Pectinatus sottacetonis]
MKKSEEFLGLPIISITEGRELGVSKSLLIDAENGRVAAIIIEDEDWYRGVKILQYESVVAIGHDAITITSSEDILTLDDAADYEPFLDQNIRIVGTKAITKGGTIKGVVSDIFIEDDGSIAKVIVDTKDGSDKKEITADEISIFGKEVTIIESEVPDKSKSLPQKNASADDKTPAETMDKEEKSVSKTVKPEKKFPIKNEEEKKVEEKKTEEKQEPVKHKSDAIKPNQSIAGEEKNEASVTASSAEDRHRRFLLGKKSTRRITTDNGIVIVDEGAEITEEVLQKAKLANKFIELSMNVK